MSPTDPVGMITVESEHSTFWAVASSPKENMKEVKSNASLPPPPVYMCPSRSVHGRPNTSIFLTVRHTSKCHCLSPSSMKRKGSLVSFNENAFVRQYYSTLSLVDHQPDVLWYSHDELVDNLAKIKDWRTSLFMYKIHLTPHILR